MPNSDHRPSGHPSSPVAIVLMLLVVTMGFATVAWLGARRESAALYGIVRSIEFPIVNRYLPHAEWFSLETLRQGATPGILTIYQNSLVYGLFFTALILVLMMAALLRLDRFSIRPHVTIPTDAGRSPAEVMKRLARDEPSVRFFLDHDVLDLPTTEGTARQPMRAIELLLYTNAIRHIEVDPAHRHHPRLHLDEDRLRAWMTDRFGPESPFMAIPKRRLLDVAEIERAVDELSWYAVLVLYPALWRVHAFHVEGADGFKTVQARIDGFIDGIWDELNGLKREFGDGLALGFASAADREERDALYRAGRAKSRRRRKPAEAPPEIAASTVLDNLTDLARVHRRGRIDRGEVEPDGACGRSSAGPTRAKGRKAPPPENLLFFGEVVSERGPGLASVAEARRGLKDILTRHLGVQRKTYPVSIDPGTGLVVYAPRLTTAEQKAFNTRAQERLARAQGALERILWGHQFEFSLVGGALDLARLYGIMPPNLFRWMRFCEETTPFWWFVQNLGMPAAYPESAGHYEHHQAEKAMGVAVERPHLHACLDGLRREAERYLVPERVDELRTILGKDAIVSEIVATGAVDEIIPALMERLSSSSSAPVSQPGVPAGRPDVAIPRTPVPPQRRALATRESLLGLFDLDEE